PTRARVGQPWTRMISLRRAVWARSSESSRAAACLNAAVSSAWGPPGTVKTARRASWSACAIPISSAATSGNCGVIESDTSDDAAMPVRGSSEEHPAASAIVSRIVNRCRVVVISPSAPSRIVTGTVPRAALGRRIGSPVCGVPGSCRLLLRRRIRLAEAAQAELVPRTGEPLEETPVIQHDFPDADHLLLERDLLAQARRQAMRQIQDGEV